MQVPPFWQALGCSWHSSTSSVQNWPDAQRGTGFIKVHAVIREDSRTDSTIRKALQIDCHFLFWGHRKTQAWELPIVLLSNYTSQLTSLHSPKEGVNCKLAGKVTGREPEDSLQHIYRYIWEDLKMQQPEGLRRRELHNEGNILANSKVTVSRTHFSYIITPWILLYKDESLRFLYLKYSFSSSQFPHTASFFYFYFLKPIPKNPTTSLIK